MTVEEIFKGTFPFLLRMGIGLALIVACPVLSTWLAFPHAKVTILASFPPQEECFLVGSYCGTYKVLAQIGAQLVRPEK